LQGVTVGGAHVRGDRLGGLAVAAYTRTKVTRGVQIGIFNETDELHGIQIGLLNRVGNNPAGLQWLPGVNAHF
nr:hypothetical protein [Candidatus Krumholzibacteria bacterium]